MERLPRFEAEQHLARRLKTPHAIETYEKLSLGIQIKRLRKKLKLSQSDLAKKLKTSQSAVARMENGGQNFTLRILIHLGIILGRKLHVKFQ